MDGKSSTSNDCILYEPRTSDRTIGSLECAIKIYRRDNSFGFDFRVSTVKLLSPFDERADREKTSAARFAKPLADHENGTV